MIYSALSISKMFASAMPGLMEILLVLIVSVLPVLGIIWFCRYLIRNTNESKRLRMEVGKLADEVQQMRKKSTDKSQKINLD